MDVVCVAAGGSLVERLRAQGVEVRVFEGVAKLPVCGCLKWPKPSVFRGVAEHLRRRRCEVAHTHLFLGNMFGRVAASRVGVPVVFASEHSTYYDKSAGAKFIDRHLAPNCRSIVAVSKTVADYTAGASGIPADKFTVIPNGVDTTEFAPRDKAAARAALNIPASAPVIGSVGRLSPEKNFEALLQGFKGLLTEFPEAVCLLAGDGPERARLASVAESVGGDRIRLLGEMPDARDVYAAMDVFALPSLREGFGLVAVEAMAMGLPVVVNALPAPAEIVEDGAQGFVRNIGEPASFFDAVATLLRDADLRRRMGEAGRRRVEEAYSQDRMVEAYEHLYMEALQRGRS